MSFQKRFFFLKKAEFSPVSFWSHLCVAFKSFRLFALRCLRHNPQLQLEQRTVSELHALDSSCQQFYLFPYTSVH